MNTYFKLNVPYKGFYYKLYNSNFVSLFEIKTLSETNTEKSIFIQSFIIFPVSASYCECGG